VGGWLEHAAFERRPDAQNGGRIDVRSLIPAAIKNTLLSEVTVSLTILLDHDSRLHVEI